MKLKKSKSVSELNDKVRITDSNSQLHLMQPEVGFPYVSPKAGDIENLLYQIHLFLDGETPAGLVDKLSGEQITDFSQVTENTLFASGGFRLISYEWGVLYAGMLKAAEVLKNKKFAEYTISRLNFIAEVCPWFGKLEEKNPRYCSPVHSVINPESMDDAGAMAAALIRANRVQENRAYSSLIDNYADFVCNKQFRFPDGTFARNRPYLETLWIDDLFMGVSLLSQLGMISGDNKYFDDAVKQVILFSDRMFNHELGLFAHGWGKDAPLRPKFYWGRANGWAFMAMIELLDVLPESHKNRDTILGLFIAHLTGITRLQSKSGLWHQLLDKNDSYTESSVSAIFIYCIAKAINRGYISAIDYGPMVILAWNALCKRINEKGHIEGICVGTGMGFEPVFYYHRPVSIYAAHGYGPTILAGIEIIQLIENHRIVNHDGALVFDFVKHE